jgi:hypothetical protein
MTVKDIEISSVSTVKQFSIRTTLINTSFSLSDLHAVENGG